MKKMLRVLSASLFILLPASRLASSDNSNTQANILVDDDKVQCPTAQFTTIQSAVNAATPGDVIRVCPGTYPEQVTISKPITLRADNGVLVNPSGVTQNSNGPSGDDSIAAIFFVQDAQDVNIDGFIVDGLNNGLTGCSPRLIGIFYQNASGRVRHNAVRHISLGSADNGCQSGNGIEVETGTGLESNVTVADNSVWGYQKNGITGNEQGTQLLVHRNTVSGIVPTTGAAQNGIQIGFGASGKVTNNTVTDNVWSPCVSPAVCETNATGILIFQSNSVVVTNNSLATNQIGVFNGGNNSTIDSNTISNSVTLIGIALVGDENFTSRNTLSHADEAAIYIQGNNNRVKGNEITDSAVGVLKISGSTGNMINGNTFFATLVTIEDPAAVRKIAVAPVR